MADDPAKALNGQTRTTVLEMLTCLGRGHLADQLRERPLPELLAAVFAELSEADDEAREAPRLRARVEELTAELVQAQEAPRHLATLNARLATAQARVLELEAMLSPRQPTSVEHDILMRALLRADTLVERGRLAKPGEEGGPT